MGAPLIYVNTGSTSFCPPIPGLKETKGVYVSDGLLDLEVLPEELLILGGGYIGLEFASMYANYGSKVTVIVDNDLFLPREDKDVASAIMDNLLKQGITFIFGAKSTQIGSENGKVALSYTKEGKAEKAFSWRRAASPTLNRLTSTRPA